jgi:hypothetical protein
VVLLGFFFFCLQKLYLQFVSLIIRFGPWGWQSGTNGRASAQGAWGPEYCQKKILVWGRSMPLLCELKMFFDAPMPTDNYNWVTKAPVPGEGKALKGSASWSWESTSSIWQASIPTTMLGWEWGQSQMDGGEATASTSYNWAGCTTQYSILLCHQQGTTGHDY